MGWMSTVNEDVFRSLNSANLIVDGQLRMLVGCVVLKESVSGVRTSSTAEGRGSGGCLRMVEERNKGVVR